MAEPAQHNQQEIYKFKLFVSGMSVKSVHAIENLKVICDEYLAGRCSVEIIDLSIHKELAAPYQIVAIPTLIKTDPQPMRTLVGDLSDIKKILTILGIE